MRTLDEGQCGKSGKHEPLLSRSLSSCVAAVVLVVLEHVHFLVCVGCSVSCLVLRTNGPYLILPLQYKVIVYPLLQQQSDGLEWMDGWGGVQQVVVQCFLVLA